MAHCGSRALGYCPGCLEASPSSRVCSSLNSKPRADSGAFFILCTGGSGRSRERPALTAFATAPAWGLFLLEIGMTTKISPVQCGSCGTVVERRSRQQRFCSPGCKERARVRRPRDRKLNAVRAVLPSYPPKKMNQINGGQKANIIGQKHVIAAEVW